MNEVSSSEQAGPATLGQGAALGTGERDTSLAGSDTPRPPTREATRPDEIRKLFRAYIERRSPWGPPWWIYGVTYGALNVIRQAAIIVAAADLSTPVRVASWVATALVAFGGVNAVAAVQGRWTARRDVGALPPETVPSWAGPKEEAA
jgi:hypothetical protein